MKKRMVCLVLVLMMLPGLIASAEEMINVSMAGFDDTQLRTWENTALFQQWNDQALFGRDESEQITLHFDFNVYKDSAAWKTAKAQMAPGSDMPDVLFKAALSTSECMEMYEKGVLMDLSGMLESYCPNLYQLLQKYPEVKAAITLPGGQIVALPYVNPIGTQNYPWINTAWLANLSLEMPTNRDEFVKVLQAFRDKDPNKNGKHDEMPLSFVGPFDVKFLTHAYGLIANDYNIFVEDGKVQYLPLDENFRPFLEWCRMLWQEGLMDENAFVYTGELRKRIADNSKETALYGVLFSPVVDTAVSDETINDYAIMMPLKTDDGKQIYRNFSGPAVRGTFAITTACPAPEAVLRWVDQFYTMDGYPLVNFGQEGTDYAYNAEGKWEMTSTAKANQFFAATRLMRGGATAPGVVNGDFEKKVPDVNTLKMLMDQQAFSAYTALPFPIYSLTKAQNAQIAPLQNDLGAYVDTMIGRFIIGDVELNDENYQQFIDTLYEMKVEDFLAFWQGILDAH